MTGTATAMTGVLGATRIADVTARFSLAEEAFRDRQRHCTSICNAKATDRAMHRRSADA